MLQGAEVVCATCVGAGGDQLQFMHFGLVVLDEGSQCRCGRGGIVAGIEAGRWGGQ